MLKLDEKSMMLQGISLSYAEGGHPNGLPLLMLHGFTDSWRSLEPIALRLPPSIRAIALSQRGYGDSAKPMGSYSVAELAQDAAAALDYLAIDCAFVFGHCMGSLVATRLAVHHPQRIAGLVLIGAMRTIKGNAVIEELWRDGVATITEPIDPGFVRSFQESTLAQPVSGAFLDTVVSESMKVPANTWRAALRSMLDDDFTSMLGRIRAPTHIIWGDQDGLVGRAEQQALAAAIPGATLNIHEGAGHAPHWENPARVAAEVVAWMRQLTVLAA